MTIAGIQADVESFHRQHGQHDPLTPTTPDGAVLQLRIDLITEEFDELLYELIQLSGAVETGKDERSILAKIAKEIADLIYVSIGTASVLGIDMAPVWEEVQRSNMAKANGPLRLDGKRLKPPGWQAPDIERIIREQVPR